MRTQGYRLVHDYLQTFAGGGGGAVGMVSAAKAWHPSSSRNAKVSDTMWKHRGLDDPNTW